ncbi:MAG: hypothetical protein KC766_11030 [Myxococcales bacterium]|nr:hypothetical protein [Myxococcales bacterium]
MRTKNTFAKRQREREKAERKREKALRREQRRQDAAVTTDSEVPPGVDPDIAHIVPGPQPVLDEE